MGSRCVALLLLLVMGAGCAGPRVVRLNTGEGRPLEYAPPSSDRSVPLDGNDFQESLARLVLGLPLTLRAPEAGGLVRASTHGATMDQVWQGTLRKAYGRWCQAHEAPGDCLSLLEDGLGFTPTDKLVMALGLSLDPMHESIAQAVEDTLNPHFFYALAVTGIVSWAALAANPEPVFTKAAAVVAAVLLIYLGVDSFLELVRACTELKWAADRATTFQELDEAGERFGRVLGREGARIFVLAVTVAVSKGMSGGASSLASRLRLLPGFQEAAALGASQVGLSLASVGEVSTVAVVDGTLVITVGSTAVAMAALGPRGASASTAGLPSGGPGKWVQVDEYMSESARSFQAWATGAPKGYAYRVKGGGEEVDFDGFEPEEGVLLEVKGPNLARFFDDGLEPKGFFKGADKFLEQADRQRRAARGMRIRWVVAEERFADALRKLFARFGYHDIEVRHLSP